MAQDLMKLVESRETRTDLPNFAPGDTVKVHVKVKEGDKERIQIFQGLVISRKAVARGKCSPSERSPAESAWSGSSL